ncbi:unnamed protein product [Alopecurus aequalis]
MAGQLSENELGRVLMQAKLAQKNIRPQRDRLLQLWRQLQQQRIPGDDDVAAALMELALDDNHTDLAVSARLNELAAKQTDFAVALKHIDLASDLYEMYLNGIVASTRSIANCLELALRSGARLAVNPAFAAMNAEQLYDALVAQRLPARPATQTEAFSRVEAAFYAVKLALEHHLPRCIELLVGERPPSVFGEPSDDPVATAAEHLAKADLSDPAPAASGVTGDSPQAAASIRVDLDQARTYLDRACSLASLAVKHIDLAVDVLSRFIDSKEVTSMSNTSPRNGIE